MQIVKATKKDQNALVYLSLTNISTQKQDPLLPNMALAITFNTNGPNKFTLILMVLCGVLLISRGVKILRSAQFLSRVFLSASVSL